MYQPKSNAVWFNLPGVVAAYQPIAAPDPLVARQNVAHDHRSVGRYTATPGVLPTWSAAKGWGYTGTQYLKSGVIPTARSTVLICFANLTAGNEVYVAAVYESGGKSFAISPIFQYVHLYYYNGQAVILADSAVVTGVVGISGLYAYKNGVMVGGPMNGTQAPAGDLFIGARNRVDTGSFDAAIIGFVKSALFAFRTLSSAEMWLASRQMAYCEQNDAWNAWGRRRYYSVPAAGGAVIQSAYYQKHREIR